MKKKVFSRIVTGIVVLSLVASSLCYADNTKRVTSFSDVPRSYWGYQTIMDMTEYGLFEGTSEPVNGVGTFSPEKTMTRAAFITAALRAVYPDAINTIDTTGAQWWKGYYVLALDKDILFHAELDHGDLDKPMSREEMAMIMVRCIEKLGEELTERVPVSQIADYAKVDEYYKDYVRDCFSYGLLCGVDAKGTFAPDRFLTRAQAATVLCRLVDEDMRIDVGLGGENTKDDDHNTEANDKNQSNNTDTNDPIKEENKWSDQEETKAPAETNKPETEESGKLPWEKPGAKQPKDYTAAEYEALTAIQKQAFVASFESAEDFDNWMNSVSGDSSSAEAERMPWENGGKQPDKYTWAEYEKLTNTQKEAFFDSFGSADAFDNWKQRVTGNGGSANTEQMPWENGGKQPAEYTWEEYEDLTPLQKEAFYDSFDDADDFDHWMNQVTGNSDSVEIERMPWEDGGKQPDEYTLEEYEALTPLQKEAFYDSFDDDKDFDRWMNQATGTGGASGADVLPWKNGGKQPEDYTWEEYESLTPLQKEAFFECLADMGGLDAWLAVNQPE